KKQVQVTKQKIYDAVSNQLNIMQQQLNEYVDTLAMLGQQYKIKVSSGNDGSVVVDGSDYKAVQLYKSIVAKQTGLIRELNNLASIKGEQEVSLKNSESSLYVTEKAFVSDRREKPVRSLVVVITMLVTLVVSILGVLLIEQIREIKQQL
ncbi:MAG TPA: hypothetical protein VG603_15805, partial [Chitinophagales bacterium]|nr:hypothetical protein [Chitinophagales bacterium]